jgi:transcriptional regulator ATRX
MLFCIRSKRKKKKKIRRIIDDAELGEETKRKIAIEKVLFFFFND